LTFASRIFCTAQEHFSKVLTISLFIGQPDTHCNFIAIVCSYVTSVLNLSLTLHCCYSRLSSDVACSKDLPELIVWRNYKLLKAL